MMMHKRNISEQTMNAITVRNLPPQVARAVRAKARREGLSLNRTVVKLLEEATGARARGAPVTLHRELDHLSGAWSQAQFEEFQEALDEQRAIDPDMWK